MRNKSGPEGRFLVCSVSRRLALENWKLRRALALPYLLLDRTAVAGQEAALLEHRAQRSGS